MNRRSFLGALTVAAGTVFVPKFEGWFRQGSGLLVPDAAIVRPLGPSEEIWTSTYGLSDMEAINEAVRRYSIAVRRDLDRLHGFV